MTAEGGRKNINGRKVLILSGKDPKVTGISQGHCGLEVGPGNPLKLALRFQYVFEQCLY